jgi:hypothetical protein
VLKWVLSFKVLRFMPSSYNKRVNSFLLRSKKRESLGEQTVPGTVPGTDYAVSGIMRLDW